MDAKDWSTVFKAASVLCGLFGAVAGVGYFMADRAAQVGRRLSESKIESLSKDLWEHRPGAAMQVIAIRVTRSDDEAKDVAEALKSAFTKARFQIDGIWPDELIGSDPTGILVRQTPRDSPFGVAVVEAFGRVGLTATLVQYGQPDTIDIYVGRKP